MIVAIDGPAGSGKSTVSKILAGRLGFTYVDTGAIYRAVTLKIIQSGLDLDDEQGICEAAEKVKIEFCENNGNRRVLLDGVDVTDEIRTPDVTNKICHVSDRAAVRQKLIQVQKDCANGVNAVVEGRDIGTVIFPDAEKKFFLSADIEERAKRRFAEVVKKDASIELAKIQEDIKRRDHKDSTREAAPLAMSDDAIFIDTTNLPIEEVVNTICKKLE